MKDPNAIIRLDDDTFVHTVHAQGIDLSFNQYACAAPDGRLLLVETGFRRDWPRLRAALAQHGLATDRIAAVVVPHFEADEMGALAEVLKDAPAAKVYAHPICAHGLEDVFGIRVARAKHGEGFEFAGRMLRFLHVPHVHQWDSMVLLDESRARLFSSDLFIQAGPCTGLREDDACEAVARAVRDTGYLPSQAHLRAAMRMLRSYRIDAVLPMHGSPLAAHVAKYIALLETMALPG